ncbi:uncharacterized protein LOC134778820 [Penaeus indicus]|uniref:uncharacterized protein LOC134778820 n=1 Tax=Penaeus indicus TaxID=29960 RepID=UPI00300D5712
MSLKVILVACVAAVALADKAPVHQPPVYAAPTYHAPAPAYHAPRPAYHAPAHYDHHEYPTHQNTNASETYPEYTPTYKPAPYHAAPKYPVY